MEGQNSLYNLDNLLVQLALQTRELSQKKDDVNQQIELCKASIIENKTYIETTHKKIGNLEEEIHQKVNTVKHFKANAKSMKVNNSLLHQYEKTLQTELDTRRNNCNQEKSVYQERIESYWKVFQQHKESYCQNPLAQQLLAKQAEKEKIDCRINACEEQILAKQKDLDTVLATFRQSSTIDNPPQSVSNLLNPSEPNGQSESHTKEDIHSPIDISALHLSQQQDTFRKELSDWNQEENMDQQSTCYTPTSEDSSFGNWCNPESRAKMEHPDKTESTESDLGSWTDVQKVHASQSEAVETMEKGLEQKGTVGEKQTEVITDEENEGMTTLPQFLPATPVRTYSHTSPARIKAVSSTPIFSLNSPSGSPGCTEASDTKSPTFLFSMNSEASTPGFSGFGFDMGTTQEDTPFTFTSSYFSDKKTSGSKSSTEGFLLDYGERTEGEFEFSFAAKSPEQTTVCRDQGAGDAFPFAFSFGPF